MRDSRRLSFAATSVLHAVGSGVRYGFDIMDHTGLPSGTVYHALSRLERDGLVRSQWEALEKAHGDGRPPRRYYRLTAQGERALAQAIARFQALRPLGLDPGRSKA
jgi:DNA-binding PadR family transcriptional regulator